jgi:integrase
MRALSHDPPRLSPSPWRLHTSSSTSTFPPTEAAALIAAMRPKDQASLGLAVYAGLRLGELLALDVSAVDLEGGWIHVRRSWDPGAKQFVPPKSRKPRKVPIIDKLQR